MGNHRGCLCSSLDRMLGYWGVKASAAAWGQALWTECLCPPPNSYVETPPPQCGGVWRQGLWEVIKSREWSLMMGFVPL